ncbi:photoreceptor cilium actin regulator-like [Oncorhynchus mykiss]|uniref:Photoreceptor cilium actin regulator n=1 Tax=Oncorhynchus mykiss TaxID=8022 RepID=A0A8C7WGK5_ONCMY|nr:photoreceptor cilium actin regulator-like [Oncorhynchus mykiss]
MGCSPSKGNNFVAHATFGRGRTLLPGGKDNIGESQSDCGGSGGSSGTGDTWERRDGERRLAGQTQSVQKEAPSTQQKKRHSLTELFPEGVILDKKVGTQETDKTGQHGKEKQGDKQDMADKKGGRKPKKNGKGVKSAKKKEKEKKAPLAEQKVDFPEPLVKAHQAAYAFLNPSISKYEILLGLLDQATQTQMSVQPMVTFMAMRYEEINRGLEEMADEGERLLKDNGEHLAWPSPMKNLSSSPPLKSGSINAEPPPDLLQQLLQYTTQRMQNVGQSVGGIGDSALEEAAEYFTSVSELLEDKLKAKHAAETRLMQLLSRIEAASLRKPGPEDPGLFSEDSGIGAESESLAGSERRLRCESCESTGSSRITHSPFGINASPVQQGAPRQKLIKKVSHSNSLNSIDSVCTIMDKGSASLDDGEEQGDDDEGEEEGQGGRTRSNASLSGPNQQPCRLVPKRIENPQNVEMTLKMKDAISGRIRFVPSQRDSAKTKQTDSPKTRCQWTEGGSPKRPQRAASVRRDIKKTPVPKEHRSQSAESVRSKGEDPTLIELERTQKDLSQRLERMSKGRTEGNTKAGLTKQNPGDSVTSPASNRLCPTLQRNNNILPIQDIAGLMKHDSGEHRAGKDIEEENKKKDKKSTKGPLKATPPPSPTLGPLKATPPPSPPLSHRPCSGLFRGRNSVKRLIDTFSQGVEEPKQEASKVLGPLKGVRKCGVHVMPGVGDIEAIMSSGVSSCRTYDLDLESLPPPPLEVLMDNSFEGAQSLTVSDVDDGIASRGRSPVPKRVTTSQKMRASMRSVSVLPSKGNLPQSSSSKFPARTVRRDISASSRVSHDERQLEVDPETEEAATLYKQARKIIHLQHSSESPIEKGHAVPRRSSPNRAASGGRQGEDSPSETVPPTSTISSQPPATPPVSRIRMLPSTPSTPSGLHRRLPSPTTFRKQPTPPSTNSPPAIRKLPTPPPLQRRLPSPPASRKVLTPNSSSSDSTHSFKAPSPPTSPRVQRWKRENSSKDSSPGASAIPQVISNARSVFCPASSSLFEAQPCPVPCPPQAWASISGSVVPLSWGNRGRLPTSVRGPKPFIRRSHSDRRPSLSLPSRAPIVSFAETCGSEPAISIHGLEDEPSREDESWDSKSDFRGNAHSASHPDLCIVGQGLTL